MRSPRFRQEYERRHTELSQTKCFEKFLLNDFVSKYATKRACEDFAETFMFFLRNRKSLHRFKGRTGVYKKLKAVERAVALKRTKLGL